MDEKKKLFAVSALVCLLVVGGMGLFAWKMVNHQNQNDVPVVQEKPDKEEPDQPQEVKPEEVKPSEPEPEPAPQEPAEQPKEPETPAKEETIPVSDQKNDDDLRAIFDKPISRVDWYKDGEITLIQNEDLKTFLTELKAFDFQPEPSSGKQIPILSGCADGFYFYDDSGNLMGYRNLKSNGDETCLTNITSITTSDNQRYVSDRSTKVLDGILQGIYDKWAQKYPDLWFQAEEVDRFNILDNESHLSTTVTDEKQKAAITRAVQNLYVDKPQSLDQANTGAYLNEELRVLFKTELSDRKYRYAFYENGILVQKSWGDSGYSGSAFYPRKDQTLNELYKEIRSAQRKNPSGAAWLSIMDQERLVKLQIASPRDRKNGEWTTISPAVSGSKELFQKLQSLQVEPTTAYGVSESEMYTKNSYEVRLTFTEDILYDLYVDGETLYLSVYENGEQIDQTMHYTDGTGQSQLQALADYLKEMTDPFQE